MLGPAPHSCPLLTGFHLCTCVCLPCGSERCYIAESLDFSPSSVQPSLPADTCFAPCRVADSLEGHGVDGARVAGSDMDQLLDELQVPSDVKMLRQRLVDLLSNCVPEPEAAVLSPTSANRLQVNQVVIATANGPALTSPRSAKVWAESRGIAFDEMRYQMEYEARQRADKQLIVAAAEKAVGTMPRTPSAPLLPAFCQPSFSGFLLHRQCNPLC